MISRVQFWMLVVALNAGIWLFVFQRQRGNLGEKLGERDVANSQAKIAPKGIAPVVVRTNAFEWAQLESEDYRTYIGRLRSIGCPEETIRDIVIADLEKLMAPEVRQAEGRTEPAKYWQPRTVMRTLDALEKQGKKQEIDFRKREILRELLGIDLAAERVRVRGERDIYDERLGFLEPEKRMRVRMSIEKANREEEVLRENSWLENDSLTNEEKGTQRAIQQRKEQEIAQVLTPEEMEKYQLWFSPSAYRVRDAFLVLEPNEGDFLALYRIQREFDQDWDGVDPAGLSASEKTEFDKAQSKYDREVKEHLGPERYAKFLQTREPDFQQLQDTIAQFGLKPETADHVYEFKKVLAEERARVGANRNLTPEQQTELLQALSGETEQAMVEVMGAKPFRYYLRTGAGRWISK